MNIRYLLQNGDLFYMNLSCMLLCGLGDLSGREFSDIYLVLRRVKITSNKNKAQSPDTRQYDSNKRKKERQEKKIRNST